MRIAVFCASAEGIGPVYIEAARKLGRNIGEAGYELVYGGTNVGLMGIVANATMDYGGRVTGIIPECISRRGVAAQGLDCLIEAIDMKERKVLLREQADAFVALPGGWGTLEEIIEVITLKQLGEHSKPIVFLNIAGFYDGLWRFIGDIRKQGFISSAYDCLYEVIGEVDKVIPYLQQYKEISVVQKYGKSKE